MFDGSESVDGVILREIADEDDPKPVKPALVPTGLVGDRAFVVFADLEELRRRLRT